MALQQYVPKEDTFVHTNPICSVPGYVSSTVALLRRLTHLDTLPVESTVELERTSRAGLQPYGRPPPPPPPRTEQQGTFDCPSLTCLLAVVICSLAPSHGFHLTPPQ